MPVRTALAYIEDRMRTLFGLLFAAAAIVMLSGCVYPSDYRGRYGAHDGYNGGYGGYNGSYDRGYGGYNGGYYDGYYGPYGGGYWASDGYFYYSDDHHNYRRDDGHHFRHEPFAGANSFRAEDRNDYAGSRRHARDDQDPDHN
jgi:hypothetical protein